MKRTAFFFLIFLTFYTSTLYYSTGQLFFSLAEILLAVGMWALSLYFRRHVKAEAVEKSIVGEQGRDLCWSFRLDYTGRLPFRHFRLPLRFRYRQESRQKRKTLSGILENKDGRVSCYIRTPYCGMLYLETNRILVYDYLGLFPGKIPFSHTVTATVLPPPQILTIEFLSPEWSGITSGQERPFSCSADDPHEIRRLREYRAGDSCRHIHWNQSARTDKLWIKEFEKERDVSISLLLDISGSQWQNPKYMDAFYRLLYAMTLGMLRKIPVVKIYWYTGQQSRPTERIVTDESQCQDILLALYRLDFMETAGSSLSAPAIPEEIGSRCFQLDTNLAWRLENHLIYQFSAENLSQEITDQVFQL